MAKKLLILLLLCLGHILYAQNDSNIWYFGGKAGLDFNNGAPVVLNDGQMETFEGSASISDSSGQLLFYTNGEKVWNKNHQVMSNGSDLMGSSSSSQACIIIPKPDSPNIYYIFTTDDFGNSKGLRYSEIDITLENGLGNVNANKNILLASPTCEKLTAVKKANNSGFWIVAHDYGSNKFLSYSVSSSGVNTVPVISAVGIPITSQAGAVGYLKASIDGTKMVSCNYLNNLELYDFNASTGQLSNVKVINTKEANYGAEFSPSGNKLYVTTGSGIYIQEIVQYNLNVPNITASAVTLSTTNSQFGALQLASDGKIYVSLANSKYLGVIHQPENLGPTCNFDKEGPFVDPGICIFGLPQPVPVGFSVFVASRSICLGSSTQFTISGNQTVIAANWNFGDGTTSNDLSPNHLYTAAGIYNVTVNVQGVNGSTIHTSSIVIAEIPFANSIKNKVACESNAVYDLTQNNVEIKGNQFNPTFKVAYFSSESNATLHNNPLQSPYNLPSGTTTFFAKIYNSENINCYSITSFKVTLLNQLVAGLPQDYTICESPYDGIAQFSLTQKDTEVLNGLDPSQFGVAYYNDYNKAIAGIDELPLFYANSNPQETIYARLENKMNSACFAVTSFLIGVGEQPIIGSLTNLVECGRKNIAFELTEKNAEVLGNLSPTSFIVQYFLSEQNAIEGSNAIDMPYFTSVNQTIYVSVKNVNNTNCTAISTFNLIVLPSLPSVLPVAMNACDDSSNDGIEVFDFDEQTNLLLDNQPSGAFEVTYHVSNSDAVSSEDAINNYSNISNPQIIYARISNSSEKSCFEVHPFSIAVHSQPILVAPQDLYFCSDDGKMFATVDLLSFDETVLNGQPAANFTITYHNLLTEAQQGINTLPKFYEASVGTQIIYVRVENTQNPSCFTVANFQIQVYPATIINVKTNYTLCENNSVEIIAPAGFDSYKWSTGETTSSIFVTEEGTITLTVTDIHEKITCSNTATINIVNSSIAIIKEIIISDWTDNQNSIRVIAEGSGNYEYSIDGETYQTSPEFDGLEVGEYTVYVKDVNGCGIVEKPIYFLIYPKFFTPNGDGYNEKWHIKPSALEPELKVYIFDSKGRLLTSLDGRSEGWDGTCNSTKLPSADYWFVVERKSGKTFKGHFSLMR
ncbi:MAG: T9SS type B sorting domain-containing protein [Flavobacterium sp.]|nr:MAG: T9SS type B sorting domain-containing protein [Flavobacterium sp.]